MKRLQLNIANKLTIGFIAVMLISSLITGFIYICLFYNSHIEAKAQTLLAYANELANSIEEKSQISLQTLDLYDTVLDSRVWIIQEDAPPIISSGHTEPLHDGSCHSTSSCKVKGYDDDFVQQVFEGQEVISRSNDKFYYGETLSVGIPISLRDGTEGAILIHTPIVELYLPIIRTIFYLFLSLLASILLTFMLAKKFAIDFTSSIRKLQHTAGMMASGDYKVRTEITRTDEIGDLSISLDDLAAKLYEASLESEKLERIRQDFVANVSHEFRTPLTIIKGNTEALIDGAIASPDTTYQNILKETRILESLVTDLLDLSRIEQNKLEFHIEQVALHEVIRDALRSIRQLAHTKKITIHQALTETPSPIATDYARLRQILIIFLDNAIKYTPEEGQVTLTLTEQADTFTLRIQDSGIGIPKEKLPYIWDRFYKAHSPNPSIKSTGLGLAIAKQLMQLLRIQCTVDSAEGIGTTMILTFTKKDLDKISVD